MRYLIDNWSFSPFLIAVVILAGWHEAGLARLARRSDPAETRNRRIRSAAFYAGLVILLIAVESPVNYLAYRYFFVHMIAHLLLMFAAPVLIVVGAPWRPLLAGLPGPLTADGSRATAARPWSAPLRRVGGFFLNPWVAVIGFNLTMLVWHLPGPYDLADRNLAVHTWLMETSFCLAGVLFWLQFIPSPPFRIRFSRAAQMVALLLTNVEMWVLAMAMSILASTSWYSVYAHVPGVSLAPFADQQIGAGILWICGDFWAVPAMVYVVRKLIAEDGDIGSAVERMLGRRGGSRGYQWAGRQ